MKVLAVLAIFMVVTSALPAGNKTPVTYLEINAKDNRIINGSPATVGQFPWQVGIIASGSGGSSWFCGGSLISDRWVLTAAHCVLGGSSFILYLGGITVASTEEGRTTVISSIAIAHNGFNNVYNNDIALIQLPSAIQTSDRIKTVQLPTRGSSVGPCETLTVSGWGLTSDTATSVSSVLNWVDVTSIGNELCALIFGSSVIINSTLCTVGNPIHGTCSGDSGGPLVEYDDDGNATQVGVVSFGAADGCELGFPSGFVRIAEFLDWIASITGINV